jgi:predicted amidohydrolase
MNGLGGLNKSPNGVVIGLVQLQLPVVVTKADLARQTERIVVHGRQGAAQSRHHGPGGVSRIFAARPVDGHQSGDHVPARRPRGGGVQAGLHRQQDLGLLLHHGVQPDGNPYNSGLIIDDHGEIKLYYRKFHPWIPVEPWEPGDIGIPVIEGPKGAKIALIICHDGMFPEMARECAYKGAEIMIRTAGYTAPIRESWRFTNQANAFQNLMVTANVCMCGSDGSFDSMGEGMIVNFDGSIIAHGTTGRADEIITAEVRPDLVRSASSMSAARRLRLQPGARAGRRGAEEDARPQGGRGREGAGDRRGRKDHRVDDQSRRRVAAVPDLVRLLQPAHDQDGEEVSEAALRALRRLWSDKDPKNAGSYFGYIDEAQYISGIVAGYTTKSGKLGFVAAKPIPQVLRNINAFTLGAKLANPKATTQVIFTGDWSMPVKEAEATNSLIDQGVDVLTCHVDGPKTMVENAARRGAMVCGYHVNQSPLAPKAYLTGAEWNWEALYPKFVKMIAAGEAIPNFYRGGLKEEIVKCSPYGEAVSAEARKHADDIKAKFCPPGLHHLQGPDHGQQGQGRDHRRHRSRPEGS